MRRLIGASATAIAFLLLLPLLAVNRMRFLPAYSRFVGVSCLLALIPGYTGLILRRTWYRCTLRRCGRDLGIDWMAVIRDQRTEIGNNVWIGNGSWIGWCVIHDDVMSGNNLTVLSGQHQHGTGRTDIPMRQQHGEKRCVSIGPDVWIGSQATIMADVARGCVIAAGAVVVADTEEMSILGGVPARTIRKRA